MFLFGQSGNWHDVVVMLIGASKAVGVGGGNVSVIPGEGTGAAVKFNALINLSIYIHRLFCCILLAM